MLLENLREEILFTSGASLRECEYVPATHAFIWVMHSIEFFCGFYGYTSWVRLQVLSTTVLTGLAIWWHQSRACHGSRSAGFPTLCLVTSSWMAGSNITRGGWLESSWRGASGYEQIITLCRPLSQQDVVKKYNEWTIQKVCFGRFCQYFNFNFRSTPSSTINQTKTKKGYPQIWTCSMPYTKVLEEDAEQGVKVEAEQDDKGLLNHLSSHKLTCE